MVGCFDSGNKWHMQYFALAVSGRERKARMPIHFHPRCFFQTGLPDLTDGFSTKQQKAQQSKKNPAQISTSSEFHVDGATCSHKDDPQQFWLYFEHNET